MLAQTLREQVRRANLDLVDRGLVMGTFGNVSGVDRDAGLFVIKASGVPYATLGPEHMVPISLTTGEPHERDWRPSSDTPTHLELYRAFDCGGIAHTDDFGMREVDPHALGEHRVQRLGVERPDCHVIEAQVLEALLDHAGLLGRVPHGRQ